MFGSPKVIDRLEWISSLFIVVVSRNRVTKWFCWSPDGSSALLPSNPCWNPPQHHQDFLSWLGMSFSNIISWRSLCWISNASLTIWGSLAVLIQYRYYDSKLSSRFTCSRKRMVQFSFTHFECYFEKNIAKLILEILRWCYISFYFFLPIEFNSFGSWSMLWATM